MIDETSNKTNNQQPVILWGVKVSPYVRKVMVALAEKNIAYEQREILPKVLLEATNQTVPAEFNHASPLGKIPALQVGDYCIADSAVIAGYLDRQFVTGNSLYPNDPQEYGRALWFERFADTTFTDVAYKKIFLESVIKPALLHQTGNATVIDFAKSVELPPLLHYLNQSVMKNLWLAGNCFSMADVAIAVQLLALKTGGFEISRQRWPALTDYLSKIIARPSFKRVIV